MEQRLPCVSSPDASLQGFACDTVRINGAGEPEGAYSPTDPTPYNFLARLGQNLLYSQNAGSATVASSQAVKSEKLKDTQPSRRILQLSRYDYFFSKDKISFWFFKIASWFFWMV